MRCCVCKLGCLTLSMLAIQSTEHARAKGDPIIAVVVTHTLVSLGMSEFMSHLP